MRNKILIRPLKKLVGLSILMNSMKEGVYIPLEIEDITVDIKIYQIIRYGHSLVWNGVSKFGLECFGTIDYKDDVQCARSFSVEMMNCN